MPRLVQPNPALLRQIIGPLVLAQAAIEPLSGVMAVLDELFYGGVRPRVEQVERLEHVICSSIGLGGAATIEALKHAAHKRSLGVRPAHCVQTVPAFWGPTLSTRFFCFFLIDRRLTPFLLFRGQPGLGRAVSQFLVYTSRLPKACTCIALKVARC